MPGGNHEARRQRETLRRRFRPSDLRLLFVGESPPASGRFFYRGDSGLYRATRDAFRVVEPTITDTNFLATFQASGCYLVDLCPEPVDDLDPRSRRAACRASEASMARTIARLQPAMIVTVVRSIEAIVARAAVRADWHGPLLHLPYPGRWARWRSEFAEKLTAPLRPLVRRQA